MGMMAMMAVPIAALVLVLALVAMVFSGGMVAHEMMQPDDGEVAEQHATKPAPVAPIPESVPEPVPEPVPDAPEVAAVAPAPVPGQVSAPTPEPVRPTSIPSPTPETAPGPAPETVAVVAPPPVPEPVVAPEPAVVAPAPVAPEPPSPAPRTLPDVAGNWSGKAAGRPFDLLISGAGDALTAEAVFVAGANRRVEKLSGAIDANGAVSLRSNDGKIRFDGKLSGTDLIGTYMQDGGRALPFSVSR